MQAVTLPEPRIDRRPLPHRARWVVGVSVVGLLLVASAVNLTDEPTRLDAVAEAPFDEPVGLNQIPATFPGEVHRGELLAVAEVQSDGLLVPTWLPAEEMTVGRSTEGGDGSYDLWFVSSDGRRYVHVVARPVGVAGSPLVEVSGFSAEEANIVRESLRVLSL